MLKNSKEGNRTLNTYNINNTSLSERSEKSEKLIPDMTSYQEFEENASFSIEREIIEFSSPEREILNATVCDPAATSKESNIYMGKFLPIGNMSISTIKNHITNITMNFISDSTQQNNSLKKLNSMIVLEKVIFKMHRGGQELIEREEEKKTLTLKKITYKRKKPFNYFLSKYRSYCIVKCEVITTFFVDNYVWSMFTNPKQRENDENISCRYLIINKETFEFEVNSFTVDNLDLDDNLVKKPIDRTKFMEFMQGINQVFRKNEFFEILENFKNKRLIYLLLCLVLFIIMISLTVFAFMNNFFAPANDPEDISVLWMCIIFFSVALAALILLFIKFLYSAIVETSQIKQYRILEFHVKNFNEIENYFEKWNVDLWIPNGIYVSCPVTLEYIQFSLDPFRDIELQHHEIGN
jgi:hypothetical protein